MHFLVVKFTFILEHIFYIIIEASLNSIVIVYGTVIAVLPLQQFIICKFSSIWSSDIFFAVAITSCCNWDHFPGTDFCWISVHNLKMYISRAMSNLLWFYSRWCSKKKSTKQWISLILLTLGCMIKHLNLDYTNTLPNANFHFNINIIFILIQVI